MFHYPNPCCGDCAYADRAGFGQHRASVQVTSTYKYTVSSVKIPTAYNCRYFCMQENLIIHAGLFGMSSLQWMTFYVIVLAYAQHSTFFIINDSSQMLFVFHVIYPRHTSRRPFPVRLDLHQTHPPGYRIPSPQMFDHDSHCPGHVTARVPM